MADFITSDNASKNKITDMLDKRHKERQLQLNNVYDLKNNEAEKSEGIDYFDQTFETKIREIKNNLNNLHENGDKTELGVIFNQITQSIQELQRYLSTSTLFLTEYKIKTCQKAITELNVKCEDLKGKLIPKKKFGFRSKKPVETVVEPKETPPGDSCSVTGSKDRQKKEFQWTISNQSQRIFILSDPDKVNNQDLTFSNLENCIIQIQGHPGSIQMLNVQNSVILTGPVARSIFAERCTNCTFAFACQQLRLHSSRNCDIYLHVTSRGIIEDSQQIHFAPFNWDYPNFDVDFKETPSLNQDTNNWQDIADFNWLSPDQPSPNWMPLHIDRQIANWDIFLEQFAEKFAITSE